MAEKTIYEIYGLHDDQVESLAEQFKDAVISQDPAGGTIVVEVDASTVTNLVHDGYFVKPGRPKN